MELCFRTSSLSLNGEKLYLLLLSSLKNPRSYQPGTRHFFFRITVLLTAPNIKLLCWNFPENFCVPFLWNRSVWRICSVTPCSHWHSLCFMENQKLLRPEQSCSQILQCWIPVESSFIKISLFMNVKIGRRWIPLFRLSRVVPLCPGCGDLYGSAHGLPLPAFIQAEIGDQEPCRISGRVFWGERMTNGVWF